jgi:hypothetical protein
MDQENALRILLLMEVYHYHAHQMMSVRVRIAPLLSIRELALVELNWRAKAIVRSGLVMSHGLK